MKGQLDDHALATLMRAAQGGNTQAYVLLLKEITPRLRQIVRAQRRFLKIADIEDLVQDVLLSLHAVRCVEDWIHFGPDGLSLQPDWFCFPAIVLVGAVPAIAMAVMLRRGAPLTPHITSALGGLAAAGLGNFG